MKKYTSLNIALLALTLFVGNRASAAIVYSGIQNVDYSQFNRPGVVSLFNAPGNWDDIYLDLYVFEDPGSENRYQFGNLLNVHGNYVEFAVGSGFFDIKNFSAGNLIGGASVWSGNSYKDFSFFMEEFRDFPFSDESGEFRNTTGYAGMRLTDGADVYFGWIQVSVSNYNNSGITGTLIDWAYESTPNVAILAGAVAPSAPVPEPGTWAAAALLAGGAALMRWRKRKIS